jgi:hypothetical protein
MMTLGFSDCCAGGTKICSFQRASLPFPGPICTQHASAIYPPGCCQDHYLTRTWIITETFRKYNGSMDLMSESTRTTTITGSWQKFSNRYSETTLQLGNYPSDWPAGWDNLNWIIATLGPENISDTVVTVTCTRFEGTLTVDQPSGGFTYRHIWNEVVQLSNAYTTVQFLANVAILHARLSVGDTATKQALDASYQGTTYGLNEDGTVGLIDFYGSQAPVATNVQRTENTLPVFYYWTPGWGDFFTQPFGATGIAYPTSWYLPCANQLQPSLPPFGYAPLTTYTEQVQLVPITASTNYHIRTYLTGDCLKGSPSELSCSDFNSGTNSSIFMNAGQGQLLALVLNRCMDGDYDPNLLSWEVVC